MVFDDPNGLSRIRPVFENVVVLQRCALAKTHHGLNTQSEEYKMKQTKKFSALAAGIVTTSLLLGASAAQAASVILDENDNVIEVKNLELNLDQDDLDGFYNVDFVRGVGSDIYGDPPEFDFPLAEDHITALIQLNNALNLNSPVPVGASSAGSEIYYVPAIEYDFPIPPVTVWAAAGAQNILGLWDACESPDCLSGIGVLRPDDINTFARFSPVPVPAAVWLFGSGLVGLVGIARRKKAA
jgi:hypothetical protein